MVHCCGAHAIRRASSVPNQLGCRDARPISEPERAPAPGPVIVSALAAAPLRWPDHRENYPSWGLVPCTWKTVFPTSPRAGRSKWHWPNCRRWPREPSYPDLRRQRSRRWAEPSFAAGARTLPLLRPRPCRTPLSAVGLTGGGRHDGGPRSPRDRGMAWSSTMQRTRPRMRRAGPSTPDAWITGWPCAVPREPRGNGSCESPFH